MKSIVGRKTPPAFSVERITDTTGGSYYTHSPTALPPPDYATKWNGNRAECRANRKKMNKE